MDIIELFWYLFHVEQTILKGNSITMQIFVFYFLSLQNKNNIQLTLVISNSMGPWKKFESTVVRLKRSYENTRSVVCLTTKGRQLEQNFEELKPASHVSILGTI